MRQGFDGEPMSDVRRQQGRTDELTPTAWRECQANACGGHDSGQMRPLPHEPVVEALAKRRLLLHRERDAGPAPGASEVRSQARWTHVVVDDRGGAERR